MTLTEIKKSLFGYNQQEVCRYVSELNEIHTAAQQANEVNHTIREVIASLYGKAVADATTVQYGGSMNAANAAELLSKEDVDGGLIGGASLKAADFSVIVKAAC